MNFTESTSSMLLEEMVYGVSHETEPTTFQDAISGPESKEWIEAIQWDVLSLEEKQNVGTLLLTSWKEGNSYQVSIQKQD